MRFIKLRPDQLDALDRRIIGVVNEEGVIGAAELRKRSRDLATLPAPTFYDRLHSLAKGGYLTLRHERQFVVLESLDLGVTVRRTNDRKKEEKEGEATAIASNKGHRGLDGIQE